MKLAIGGILLATLVLTGCSDTAESKQDSAKAACLTAIQQQVDVKSDDILADMQISESGTDAWIMVGTLRGKGTPYRCEATWDTAVKHARSTATIG